MNHVCMHWSLRASVLLAFSLIILSLAAHADSLKDDAQNAGHAVGSTVREIGQGAKQVGKDIGHGAKEAAHAVADAVKEGVEAAKEGGREFKRGVKGQ